MSKQYISNKFAVSGGTSNQYLMADGSVSTLTNPVTGTGANGQVAFWTGTNSQSGDNNLFWDNTNKYLGLWTPVPTHPITLSSTAGALGSVSYNTSDQTVNYERVREYWSGNVFNIKIENGGSGVRRDLFITNTNAIGITILGSVAQKGQINLDGSNGSTTTSGIGIIGNYFSNGTGSQNIFSVLPTIQQTASAGYRGLWISPYEQTLGTGSKYLIDAGINTATQGSGTHTSYYTVDNRGKTGMGTVSTSSMLTIQGDSTMDGGQLGAETMTTGAGSSWTGSGYATGYQHTTGDTSDLISAVNLTSGNYYYAVITITNRTAGTITIKQNTVVILQNFNTNTNIGFKASGTAPFIITPTTDFDGTVTLSVKSVGTSVALISPKNSSGIVTGEKRYSTSSGNIFEGMSSGYRIVNGIGNTAYGYVSLRDIISGNYNSAIGYSVLQSNINGSYNVGMGYSVFTNYNPSGGNNYNIGIGSFIASSTSAQTGTLNTFVGNYNAINLTSGTSNTGIGYQALNNLTSGGGNVALGGTANYGALHNVTSGNYNIGIGYGSLLNSVTGSSNIAIGIFSGRFIADGITSNINTNQSIFIGDNTKAQADNQTNQIVIGYYATGNGNNTVTLGSPSITQTYLQGNVGVAGSVPTHPLTLSSTAGANGIVIYNTPDQTTNYERVRNLWYNNAYYIQSEKGGTGVTRTIVLYTATNGTAFTVGDSQAVTGSIAANRIINSNNCSLFGVVGTYSGSSGINIAQAILPNINQSSTAGYKALWISSYEQTVGTGSKLLIDAGINSATNGTGTHTSKYTLDNSGNTVQRGYMLISSSSATTTAMTTSTMLDVRSTVDGSNVMSVSGVNGQLLRVDDTVVGNIYSVNDVSGLPILSVNSNHTVTTSGNLRIDSSLNNSISAATTVVTTIDATANTSAFVDYYIKETTTNAMRSGTITAVWDGTNITYTQYSTGDLNATTSGITLTATLSAGTVNINAVRTAGTWNIKTSNRLL